MRKSKVFMLGIMVMSMVATTAMPAGIANSPISGVSVYAATTSSQGKCGDYVTYKYDGKTNTLTVSGKGAMWDDYGFANKLYDTKKIIIESGVTTIGSYSFSDLISVDEIVIADTVTTIKENAFPVVNGSVEIPKSVVKVENLAFHGAEKFIIKGDVKGYEPYAFGGTAYSEVVLYGDAQDLGKALFLEGVNTVTIAQENTKCKVSNGCLLSADGKQLYYALSSRDTLKIPDSVENIAVAAFNDRGFKKIELGKNVKNIRDFAFVSSRVKNLVVNKKLTNIGTKAFYDTKIKNVEFKGKVKLGVVAFEDNVVLKYNKLKSSQTTIDTATVGKKKYNIRFAKVSGAKGYQIKVKKGKKTYTYTTTKNSYTKNAPKALTKKYRKVKRYELEHNEYLDKISGAAYVTVRPYKISKKKKVYGRWSQKMVLSYNK